MMRIRDDITRSALPLTLERDRLDLHRVEVDDRRRRRSVEPAAPLPRVDDERLALTHLLVTVRAPMHDELVRLDRPVVHVADVVHDEDPLAAELEAVRGLEQLELERLLGLRPQALRIPVVLAEHA